MIRVEIDRDIIQPNNLAYVRFIDWLLRKPAISNLTNPVVTATPNMVRTLDDLHPQITPPVFTLQNPHPRPADNANTLQLLAPCHR